MQQPASWTPPAVLEGLRTTLMWRCANHVGSQYLRLHYSEVDDLCQWALDSREACQQGATLEDLIKRDVTSTNANKEHGSKDVTAVIDITDHAGPGQSEHTEERITEKNTRNGGRGRGEEHNWVTISGLR